MMHRMELSRSLRKLRHGAEDMLAYVVQETKAVVKNVGLVSAGITVLALGVVVGREIRQRYKFTRRTPYDVYARSGERGQELGVGI